MAEKKFFYRGLAGSSAQQPAYDCVNKLYKVSQTGVTLTRVLKIVEKYQIEPNIETKGEDWLTVHLSPNNRISLGPPISVEQARADLQVRIDREKEAENSISRIRHEFR